MVKIRIAMTADWHGGGDREIIDTARERALTVKDENIMLELLDFAYRVEGSSWIPADWLIVAGDLTGGIYKGKRLKVSENAEQWVKDEIVEKKVGPKSYREQRYQVEQFLNEVEKSDYEVIIVCFGNHETAFDFGWRDNKYRDYKYIKWLRQRVREFNENNPNKRLYFDVFAREYEIEYNGVVVNVLTVPYTDPIIHPKTNKSVWAFEWNKKTIAEVNNILSKGKKYDIIVSHGPVYGYGDSTLWEYDENYKRIENRLGTTIFDKMEHKPNYFISGHIHAGYGKYKGKDNWEGTTFVCCSNVDENYVPINDWMRIEFEK